MKFVLDASVAVKWVLPEADSAQAIQLQEDWDNGLHDLIAPDILGVETAHALTRAERRGLIPQGDAIRQLSVVSQSMPTLFPYLPLLPRVLSYRPQPNWVFTTACTSRLPSVSAANC